MAILTAPDLTAQTARSGKPTLAENILDRVVPGDDVEYFTTSDAFRITLRRAQAPGGVVRIVTCVEDPVNLAWSPMGQPLGRVLESLVIADPRYRWEIVDRVVNLLPKAGEPAFLGARIKKFHIEHVTEPREALNQLLRLPEVKHGRESLGLKPGVALIDSLSTPHPNKFSVHCTDVTLREALNAIARAEGRGVWEYIEVHCQGKREVVIRF
jgi:hypothetical protein